MKAIRCFVSIACMVMLASVLTPRPAASAEQLDLTKYTGHVVYLDFFASWCAPCLMSFPWMAGIQEKYRDQGLRIVAVNLDKTRGAADAFLKKVQATFDVVFNPDGSLAEKYRVRGMPHSFLLDRSGKVVAEHIGFLPADKQVLEQRIAALLQSKN